MHILLKCLPEIGRIEFGGVHPSRVDPDGRRGFADQEEDEDGDRIVISRNEGHATTSQPEETKEELVEPANADLVRQQSDHEAGRDLGEAGEAVVQEEAPRKAAHVH